MYSSFAILDGKMNIKTRADLARGASKTRKGTGKFHVGLEVFRFGIYLAVPIIASVLYNDEETMRWLVQKQRFIVYPEHIPKDIQKDVADKRKELLSKK